jgi:aminoglycoside phosphotransferase (APT) family kinase protein
VRRFVELQVAMHNCTGLELPSQREILEKAIQIAPRLTVEMKEQVWRALDRLPDGDAICHGDYHPGNIIMSPQGPVVIDWFLGMQGNPLADVVRTSLLCQAVSPGTRGLVRWLKSLGQGVFHTLYLREYSARQPFDVEQFEAWIPVVAAACLVLSRGVPEEQDRLIALVETSMGE